MDNHHTQQLQSLSDHRLLFRFSSKCCLMRSHWGAVKGAHPSLLHTLLRLFCIKAILWTLANESPGLRRAQWFNAQTSLFIDSHTISRVPSGTTTGNTWQRGCRGKADFHYSDGDVSGSGMAESTSRDAVFYLYAPKHCPHYCCWVSLSNLFHGSDADFTWPQDVGICAAPYADTVKT